MTTWCVQTSKHSVNLCEQARMYTKTNIQYVCAQSLKLCPNSIIQPNTTMYQSTLSTVPAVYGTLVYFTVLYWQELINAHQCTSKCTSMFCCQRCCWSCFNSLNCGEYNVLQQAILSNWTYMLTWVCLKDNVELARVIAKICKHSNITPSDEPNTSSQMIRQILSKPPVCPLLYGMESKVIIPKILLLIPHFVWNVYVNTSMAYGSYEWTRKSVKYFIVYFFPIWYGYKYIITVADQQKTTCELLTIKLTQTTENRSKLCDWIFLQRETICPKDLMFFSCG